MKPSDRHFTTGYDSILAHGQSKTANVLFAVDPESAQRLWELSEQLLKA